MTTHSYFRGNGDANDEAIRFHASRDLDPEEDSELIRIRNNLDYIAVVMSDVLEALKLVPPAGTADPDYVDRYPECMEEDCDGNTFTVIVDPDEEPAPLCHAHFTEVMNAAFQDEPQ